MLEPRAIVEVFNPSISAGSIPFRNLNLHTLKQSAAGSADLFQRGSPYFRRSEAPSG